MAWKGMRVGGMRELRISPRMAYREEGVEATIPPTLYPGRRSPYCAKSTQPSNHSLQRTDGSTDAFALGR